MGHWLRKYFPMIYFSQMLETSQDYLRLLFVCNLNFPFWGHYCLRINKLYEKKGDDLKYMRRLIRLR